jgi:hypothetical protein
MDEKRVERKRVGKDIFMTPCHSEKVKLKSWRT